MKVLFVCRGNAARSQLAQTLFDKLSKHESDSAGTKVGEKHGQTVMERTEDPDSSEHIQASLKDMLEVSRKEGLDFSENIRKQVTASMVHDADNVIVMTDDDPLPDFMIASGEKVVRWDVPDGAGMSYDFQIEVKNQIKQRVERLVREIG